MSRTYYRKPETVEAVQYTGDNIDEILYFCKGQAYISLHEKIREYSWEDTTVETLCLRYLGSGVEIDTSDYVIKRSLGSYCVTTAEAFNSEYEQTWLAKLLHKHE